MGQTDDHGQWLRMQLSVLECLLADYERGNRIAIYDLPNGQRHDETSQVIAQLRHDIVRLRNARPGTIPAVSPPRLMGR